MMEQDLKEIRGDIVNLRMSQQENAYRISSHEDVCTERYLSLEKSIKTVIEQNGATKRSVDGLYNRFWMISTSVIALLLTVVGYLVNRVMG